MSIQQCLARGLPSCRRNTAAPAFQLLRLRLVERQDQQSLRQPSRTRVAIGMRTGEAMHSTPLYVLVMVNAPGSGENGRLVFMRDGAISVSMI